MNVPSNRERLTAAHRDTDHFYLLVDPLASGAGYSPISLPNICDTLGDAAVTLIERADLAYAPDHCPRLVTLALPGATPDSDLLDASLSYAELEAGNDKRYVCGWLSSAAAPELLTLDIAQRCVIDHGDETAFVPLFEPIRHELLAALAPDEAATWLGPVNRWLYPSADGEIRETTKRLGDEYPVSINSLTVQGDVPLVVRILAGWRASLSLPLSYAPARGASRKLPPGAALSAWRELQDARAWGLNTLENQLVFALHRLNLHPRLDGYSIVREAIHHVVSTGTPLADQFDRFSDTTWAQILSARR
ncbi:hypothetical protein [Burkholderia sp. D-99]|uniref:hypothetical protein n=1 Tax=Burkholderia sp. D-99 TaxID=2717316 RepID=UPI0014232AC0|nr:hypothetical protein [Burkholderia sp. D-99]NHV24704.1 hypothetical protein [Burkholderia sp. D-99]